MTKWKKRYHLCQGTAVRKGQGLQRTHGVLHPTRKRAGFRQTSGPQRDPRHARGSLVSRAREEGHGGGSQEPHTSLSHCSPELREGRQALYEVWDIYSLSYKTGGRINRMRLKQRQT